MSKIDQNGKTSLRRPKEFKRLMKKYMVVCFIYRLLSKTECQSMGMDGWEQRSLDKFQHCWESSNLYPAGVDHFLLPTTNANILYKMWREAWCMVFTITKHWGGYCRFGASFLNFVFQNKKLKLWNKWSFVQNKTSDYTSCLNNSVYYLVALIYKMNL